MFKIFYQLGRLQWDYWDAFGPPPFTDQGTNHCADITADFGCICVIKSENRIVGEGTSESRISGRISTDTTARRGIGGETTRKLCGNHYPILS